MNTSSCVPAFLDALVAALQAAPALAGVVVVDGLPVVSTSRLDILAVGISVEDVQVESVTSDAGLGSRRERVDVTCQVQSWTGDTELSPRRARAFAVMLAVEDVLAADRTVSGTVTRARVTSHQYAPAVDERGMAAFVEFHVTLDAFRP